jgi:2-polyprenyl-6-methoxyphenol hydroxylase-like FAD-dependent oxidoreductase
MEVKSPVQTADVLIVGAGPAGLMASLCLHTYGLSVIHIDNRPRPTDVGRADGIQPRTLEAGHLILLNRFIYLYKLQA